MSCSQTQNAASVLTWNQNLQWSFARPVTKAVYLVYSPDMGADDRMLELKALLRCLQHGPGVRLGSEQEPDEMWHPQEVWVTVEPGHPVHQVPEEAHTLGHLQHLGVGGVRKLCCNPQDSVVVLSSSAPGLRDPWPLSVSTGHVHHFPSSPRGPSAPPAHGTRSRWEPPWPWSPAACFPFDLL